MFITKDKVKKSLIFANLIILMVLPQLNNVHYDPLPQFWAEITFVWASITLFVLVCFIYKRIAIPKISIFLLLFAIFLCIQQFFITIDFVGLSYVAAIEFFILILLATSTSTITLEYGLATFVTYLSIALIIGGICQSFIGFIQYNGLVKYFGDYIFYDSAHPTTNIFGHFGQRNHYCHYLSWAVFGLIYLFRIGKIKSSTFILLTAWFIFSMTIAGSRSVFIYFGLASLIALINLGKNRNQASFKLFILILITSFTLVAFEYLFPMIHSLFSHHHISSGLQRIVGANSDGGLAGRRLVEWEKAWIVFKHCPIFGYGFNEYAKQSVYLQPFFPNAPLNDGLFTNCHNLILQLLAETGLIGTLIVVSGIIYAIYNLLKRNSLEIIIILCMLATTLAHSMVEYPLWYIYFLGPCIIFLALDKPLCTLNNNIIILITIIPLTALVYLLVNSSFLFSILVDYNDPPSNQQAFIRQAQYLEGLTNNTLWAYPALYTLDNYITIDTQNTNKTFSTQIQLAYENRFTNFHPYPDNLIKQAMLNWNLGNTVAAKGFLRLALVSYPVYKNSYLTTLKAKHYQELYIIAKNYQYKK